MQTIDSGGFMAKSLALPAAQDHRFMTASPINAELPALLADAIAATITPTATDSAMIDRLLGDLRNLSCRPTPPQSRDRHSGDPPASISRYLPSLAAAMPSTPAATALRPLFDRVDWYQIFDGADIPGNLATGLVAGQIIGGRGLLTSGDLYLGLFLLAPQVTYPLHQHASLEIYCVLSGAVSIRHGRAKPAQRIQAGGHSVTPPHQVHELQTDDEACLIAYIWTGDLTGENWWWEEQPDGSWDRVCWQRQADSSWKVTHREPLSPAEIARSGDK
jgi:quercetin dioxygenase-like cupin family protein